jgi:2-methylcitrate dehydratase PrpD
MAVAPASAEMTPSAIAGVTAGLAERVVSLELDAVPNAVRRIARFALMDWYAVTFAGASEPAVTIIGDEVLAHGNAHTGTSSARIIGGGNGRPTHGSASQAAMINGAAGHALDYDDVHNALPGHATAPVAPAVLALGESTDASGRAVLTAFIAGFETACRVGTLVSPGLFRRGWQASTTAGAIGAAAACARLLGLDARKTNIALGLAAGQACGLQAAFGSMAKCLAVGHAAQSGLLAAGLAARGFEGAPDLLEMPRGFAEVYADGADAAAALADPPGGWHLCRNLFKHHASCFMTHAPLEALAKLRADHGLGPDDAGALSLRVEEHYHRVVLTPPPATGYEAKFNLRFCLAMALAGLDTGNPVVFSETTAKRQDLQAIAERIGIVIDAEVPFTAAQAELTLKDGGTATVTVDAGEPEADLDRLEPRLEEKVIKLLTGVPVSEVFDLIHRFGTIAALDDIGDLHPAVAS